MTSIDPSAKAPFEGALGKSVVRLLADPARLRLIAQYWILLAAALYITDLLPQTRNGRSDGGYRPFGDDFVNYWSAAFLALHGRAQDIYDFHAFHAFERSITGPNIGFYHYSYPPVLLLLSLPLALI